MEPILAENEDVHWMRLALAEAARGRGSVEPNPLVGAVVVREGRLVGLGHHERFGGPHAEVVALGQAGAAAAERHFTSRSSRVAISARRLPAPTRFLPPGSRGSSWRCRDPFPEVNGGGLATLEAAGLLVEVGCEAELARSLNAPYLKRLTTGMPFVTAKWAMTLDGKTAAASGDSRWISSDPPGPWSTSCEGEWMRSWSASARSKPTIPC